MLLSRSSKLFFMTIFLVGTSNQIHSAEPSTWRSIFQNLSKTNIALIAAGTVGTVALAKILYDSFFGLTDLEEIEQILTMLENAQATRNTLIERYNAPLAVIEKNKNNATSEQDTQAELKTMIRATRDFRPFLNFERTAATDCQTVTEQIEKIEAKKAVICTRRVAIMQGKRKYDVATTNTMILKFNELIERANAEQNALKKFHQQLNTMRVQIKRFEEYEKEYAYARIESLEAEVHQLKLMGQRTCVHYYPQPYYPQQYYYRPYFNNVI